MKTQRSRFSRSKTKTRKSGKQQTKNPTKKFLQIKTSSGHIFPALIDIGSESELTVVKFYYGKFIPCVEIHIYNNNPVAHLQTLTYNEKCSLKGLERKTGTKEMVQTSVKFVMDIFPHVNKIEISDYSSLNINPSTSIVITAKYLLQGRPGLYEDYLGAIPTNKTKDAIHIIQEKRDMIDKNIKEIVNDGLWTPKKIKNITARHNINKEALLFSTWIVDREVVNTYNVQYTVHRGFSGGGKNVDFDKMELDYNPYFRMYYNETV